MDLIRGLDSQFVLKMKMHLLSIPFGMLIHQKVEQKHHIKNVMRKYY